MRFSHFAYILVTSLLLSDVYPVSNVFAGGALSTISNTTTTANETTYSEEQDSLTALKEVIPTKTHGETLSHIEESYLGASSPIVQNKINSRPIICYTATGLFRPTGSFALRIGTKVYIYSCYILNDLGYGMQVTHCTKQDNTLYVHSRPVPKLGGEGGALHNSTKLIVVEDANQQLTHYGLVTNRWYGNSKVVT